MVCFFLPMPHAPYLMRVPAWPGPRFGVGDGGVCPMLPNRFARGGVGSFGTFAQSRRRGEAFRTPLPTGSPRGMCGSRMPLEAHLDEASGSVENFAVGAREGTVQGARPSAGVGGVPPRTRARGDRARARPRGNDGTRAHPREDRPRAPSRAGMMDTPPPLTAPPGAPQLRW